MNSVVILFIIDVDELFYEILMVSCSGNGLLIRFHCKPSSITSISSQAINLSWVESMCYKKEEESMTEIGNCAKDDEEDVGELNVQPEASYQSVQLLAGDVEELKKDVVILHKTLDMLQEQNSDLKRKLTMPQDGQIFDTYGSTYF